VNWDPNGDLVFDIRVEKEKGIGITVGYVYLDVSQLGYISQCPGMRCGRHHLGGLPESEREPQQWAYILPSAIIDTLLNKHYC
jgi:hypothetical protein